jgi:pimeloyl-ACP methyl ester carboxylesterase
VHVSSGTAVVVRRDAAADEALPTAVFVHGLGGSSFNWTALAAELRDTVDAELVDLPGFGYSTPPHDGDYSLSAHCRAVEGLILSLGRKAPVHLLGNSLGGAVVTRVAARRPDLVRTVTLVSPALPDLKVRGSEVPTALMAAPGVGRLVAKISRDMPAERRTKMFLELCYGEPGTVAEEVFTTAVEEFRRRRGLPYALDAMVRSTRGLVASYLERGPLALWRQAAQVQAPTLLVYGRRDKLVNPRSAARAMDTFPDPRLLVVPESGHVAMLEHPRIVARAFRELIVEESSGAARPGGRNTTAGVTA